MTRNNSTLTVCRQRPFETRAVHAPQGERCRIKVIKSKNKGFTLIEVLIALAILAIALTALLKNTAQTIENTQRIKDKSIKHWVGMQAITVIQLKQIPIGINQTITQSTPMLGHIWYWQAHLSATPIKTMQQISVTVSADQHGPFTDELVAFRHD